tara:strand:+ start:468 stop:701 length:234 start_codon:yes stop_codon:yes gene_type:complete
MQLEELEKRLKACEHVGISVRLDDSTVVVDVPEFIHSHLNFASTYDKCVVFNPYKERLIKLLSLLEAGVFDRESSRV